MSGVTAVIYKQDNEYYTKSFLKKSNGELFVKWNWAAFIFGPSWLCYRKSYLLALKFLFLATPIYALHKVFFTDLKINLLWSIFIIHILYGLYGTSLYGKMWGKLKGSHSENTNIWNGILFFVFAEFFVGIYFITFLSGFLKGLGLSI